MSVQTIWAPFCAVGTTIDPGRVGGVAACLCLLSFLAPFWPPSHHSLCTNVSPVEGHGFQHQEAVDLLWRRAVHPPEGQTDCNLLTTTLPLLPKFAAPGCNIVHAKRCSRAGVQEGCVTFQRTPRRLGGCRLCIDPPASANASSPGTNPSLRCFPSLADF